MTVNPIIRAPYFEPPNYEDEPHGSTPVFGIWHGRRVHRHPTTARISPSPLNLNKTKIPGDLRDENKKKDAIYFIVKPALFLSKNMGIFPLSGAYECHFITNQYWRRMLFDNVIPIGAIVWLSFIGFSIMNMLATNDALQKRRGVDYYSVLITNFLNVMLSLMPAIVAYFRNHRMADYIKMFTKVDNILAENKFAARRVVLGMYVAILSVQVCKSYSWSHLISKVGTPDGIQFDLEFWGILAPVLKALFYIGLCFHSVGEIHTQVAYFAIVYAIGVGFRTIRSKMEKLDAENSHLAAGDAVEGDVAYVVQKLRELRLQHVFLVQMGRRLDRLFSPILFMNFIVESMTTSVILFQLINTMNYATWIYPIGVLFYGLAPFSAMMMTCTFADRTIKAGNSIAGIIFASDLTANTACRNEITLFALQLNVHQVYFTASGFFPINHSLAGTIIGIAITYSIVMIQLRGAEKEE